MRFFGQRGNGRQVAVITGGSPVPPKTFHMSLLIVRWFGDVVFDALQFQGLHGIGLAGDLFFHPVEQFALFEHYLI